MADTGKVSNDVEAATSGTGPHEDDDFAGTDTGRVSKEAAAAAAVAVAGVFDTVTEDELKKGVGPSHLETGMTGLAGVIIGGIFRPAFSGHCGDLSGCCWIERGFACKHLAQTCRRTRVCPFSKPS